MSIQVESYRKETTLPSRDEGLDAIKERQARLKEAGFSGLITAKTQFEKLDSAEILYGELKGKELDLWGHYLPTAHTIESYAYDDIPDEALNLVVAAQKLGVFDEITIWTPEGSSGVQQARMWWRKKGAALKRLVADLTDPMALGVIVIDDRKHFFPIARWGESLLSLKQIKRSVRLESLKAWSLTVLPIVLTAAVVIGMSVVSFQLSVTALGWGLASAIWGVGIILTGWLALMIWLMRQ